MQFSFYLISPILAIILFTFILHPRPNKFPTNEKPQIELEDSNIMIWYGDHALKFTGWAERPVLQFETQDLIEPLVDQSKLKKWDTYIIMDSQIFMEIRLMDYAYAQIISIKIIDLELGMVIYENEEIDLENKKLIETLNDESIHYRGAIKAHGKNINIDLANTLKSNYRPTYKNISLHANGLSGKINMMRPVALRDIVVYQSVNAKKNKFVFMTKGYNIPAKGQVIIKNKEHKFLENSTTSGYCLGRGIFDLQTAWVWIHGNGFQNHTRIGINLGGGIQNPDGANSTEDAFFVNDDMIKLKSAEVYQYYEDTSKEWVFKTKQFKEKGDFEIYFTPKKNVQFGSNFQYNHFYNTQLKQYIGEIHGKVKKNNKDIETFKNIQAYAETFQARW